MSIRKRRESKQSVIVVLEGIKICIENTGVAPLLKAVRQVNNAEDEILVLTLLHAMEATGSSTYAGCREDQQCNQLCEEDPHISFLCQEISDRKEVYKQIFRPFYDCCKSKGVKFQVKIAAGFRPRDVIIEEANNSRATWIVMDSCFSRHVSFRLNGTDCNVSLVSNDDEAMVPDHHLDSFDRSECSMIMEEIHKPKSPKLMKGFILQEDLRVNSSLLPEQQPSSPFLANTSKQSENQTLSEAQQDNENITDVASPRKDVQINSPIKFSKAKLMLGQPLQLSWEVIMEITDKFTTKALMGQCKNYVGYLGYLSEYHAFVLVKRFTGDSSSILEAEKKAAWSMRHKNILGLLGYHQSDSASVSVYPHPREGTLDNMLCPSPHNELKLKFQQKLKIAIGIAEGVRYMHQECPRGPIAHGELQLHNIFLRHDLRPMARPLMLQRKFHELLEEDLDFSDMHGIYRVMAAATQCTISDFHSKRGKLQWYTINSIRREQSMKRKQKYDPPGALLHVYDIEASSAGVGAQFKTTTISSLQVNIDCGNVLGDSDAAR
ncbi:receptor-like cytosolic serine/threonine-protein kinase rbk1 [Citrus sinensis]|nr:receptor-like cytosolic serine/threonine-protein kinase rbk1 [Citrus sinensis]